VKRQEWVCEVCGLSGVVEHEEHADVLTVVRAIARTGEISPHWRMKAFHSLSNDGGYKCAQLIKFDDGASHTRHLTNPAEYVRVEYAGIKLASPGHYRKSGSGPDWFDGGAAASGSNSLKRKAASAMLAKIPFPLAQHIARVFKPTEAELSVAGPKITAVNVLLPGCDARTDDGRPHGTQPCSRETRMRKAKFGQPMPDSGKVNRVRSGSRVVRTDEVSGSGSRDRTIAECGAF
jgi:hypothetical protein